MNCPTCGSENEAEARFCIGCEVPLESRPADPAVYCTNCGSENLGEARFCIRCGLPIGGPPEPPPDRRGPGPVGTSAPRAEVLVPRDLGDLVSETFRVLGASFWAFFLIALVAQSPALIITIFWPALADASVPLGNVLVILLVVAGLFLTIIAEGAMIYAVALHYLGRQIKVTACYSWAANRFWALLIASILAAIVIGLCFVTVIGIPVAIYLIVSWYFYIPAILLEKRGPVQALDRSRHLVGGTWWRVLGIGIVFVILFFFVALAIGIPIALVGVVNPIAGDVVSVIAGSAAADFLLIGTVLVYFDLRIRKEGYTLETLAQEVGR